MTPERPRHVAFFSRLPRVAQLTPLLLAAALLLGSPPPAQAANLPTGGSVAAGGASIGAATGNSLTVTQTSPSAVLNWQSFSVGQGYSVNFLQPSSSAVILNRVTGSTTSTIAGAINANGHVYLINPNGIVITATGTVNAAGFVASSLGISDDDFMAGKRTFTGAGASAAVANAGVITIGRGGYAALLGGAVDNVGTIVVPLGKVGLGSGEQATLDFSGDGFLQVAIPTAATGSGALVANSGRILADGGLVMLSAAAAKDMARQAINMSGAIEAKSVSGQSGDIVLAGGDGAVDVSGKLDATSSDSTGGTVTVTGRAIRLTGATLDASGASGGGSVKVGGDRQGKGTLAHADTLSVDAASTIKADATSTGNGGDVVLWSDELTTFAGTISAKGGALSGNGGQAEVSGKKLLSYTGFTNLSAAHGSFGTLLLDPYNVTISSGADSNADTTSNAGTTTFTATGTNSVINAATLISALGGANVTVSTGTGVSQSGDITVAAALGWSSGSTLTLTAANSIAVNANITIAGSGGLALNYGGGLSFASGKSVTYTKADGSAATTSQGGTLAINGPTYTLLYSMADIKAIDTSSTKNYALATSLDAGTNYTAALVGSLYSPFSTVFEGLGHTISGLTIASSDAYVGLFASNFGTIRDIGLIGGSVSGDNSNGSIGSLVGYNSGTIINAYATGAVSGSGSYVGGLVGYNTGSITNSYASGAVSGSGSYVGGLVGENDGTIEDSYASGAVSGTNGDSAAAVGGLVGINTSTIRNAYATGAVSGSGSVSYVGGLVGNNAGSIINSYASGAVSGTNGDSAAAVGGLVGINTSTIINAYATGAVSGVSNVGGLIGYNNGVINTSYWDTSTSGQSVGIGSDDNSQLATGLTTALLQGALPSGFSTTIWGIDPGLYPYLKAIFPDGVQAISGTAYSNAGSTVAASGSRGAVTVTAIANQTLFGTATTGANGYYYIFGAAGAFDSGDSLLAYTRANAMTGAANAATLATATSAAAQSSLTLCGDIVGRTTTATTLSAAPGLIASLTNLRTSALAAAGSDAAAQSVINAATYQGLIAAGAFTIDQTIDTASSLLIVTASGNALTVASPITVEAGGSLGLLSGGTLAIDAQVTVKGAGALTLAYDAGTATNLTFASGAGVSYTGSGGALTINNTGYTLLYSMNDIDAIDTTDLEGTYALANSLAASGTYTSALVVQQFSGTFEGLGNTITGLTISGTSSVGLFANVGSRGVVRDIGLVGGSVSSSYVGDNSYAGGLAGYNAGSLVNAYATGTVSSSSYGGYDSRAGGLVGYNIGSISNAYATGSVSSSSSDGYSRAGGLVGYNIGSISNAYATGAVSSSSDGRSYAGGLVGYNTGSISNAYATGAVSSSGSSLSVVGGLVGSNSGGTVSNAYWDTETSGQSSSSGGGTRLTTAQFQTLAAATNLGSAFTLTSGLYPYLTSFFPNGVQAVSGTAYKADGTTVLASGSSGAGVVYVRLGNGSVISATTGANGYYYVAVANGGINTTSGTSVLAYTVANANTGAANAANYTTKATASLPGFNVYGGLLAQTADSGVSALSALDMAYASATSGTTASGLSITNRTITALASGFSIDATASVSGTLALSTPGSLTIARGGSVSGADVSLKATGAFINNAGSGAVTASNRWLIYSADSDGDTFGGLDSGNTAVWNTAAGATVSATGNRYVFAHQPTVTVKTINASKTYGDDGTTDLTPYYAITGLSAGVAGAYQADTAASILSGAVSVSSDGLAATANAKSYSYTLGSLTAGGGYAISLLNTGTLTVAARPITVTADAKSSVYGDATPSLTYGITSGTLVGTDTLSGSLATTATSSSSVGIYAITKDTLANSNYAITYVGANLTITARPITVTADAQSRTYGDANPGLTYSVTSGTLVGTDTLSGSLATTATSSSSVGIYAITKDTLANSNYAITYVGANLTITARPITITANAASSVYGATPNLTYVVGGSGLANHDTLSGSLTTAATTTSAAGSTHAITQGSLTNANNGNYDITYAGNTLTITQRPITVTANSLSGYQGNPIPALTYTVGGSGLANGEALSGSLATTATSTSPTGTYAITQGSVQASANYSLTFVPGSLTIAAMTSTDTSAMPSAIERSWRFNNVESGLASPSGLLSVTFGGSGDGEDITFSSPRFDGVSFCPGGDCGSRTPSQRL